MLSETIKTWVSGEDSLSFSSEQIEHFLAFAKGADTPSECLRQLAIYCEHEPDVGWTALKCLYKTAHQLDPNNTNVLHSLAISALYWMTDYVEPDLAKRKLASEDALVALNKVLTLNQRDADAAYTFGLLYYDHPARQDSPEEYDSKALSWFSKAKEWQPNHVMAQLYFAHCLHDAKRWEEAVQAYQAVDRSTLLADWPAWRALKLQEQLACCLAFSGRPVQARAAFAEFLTKLETLSDDELDEEVTNLDDCIEALSGPIADEELATKVDQILKRMNLTDLYPKWKSAKGEASSC